MIIPRRAGLIVLMSAGLPLAAHAGAQAPAAASAPQPAYAAPSDYSAPAPPPSHYPGPTASDRAQPSYAPRGQPPAYAPSPRYGYPSAPWAVPERSAPQAPSYRGGWENPYYGAPPRPYAPPRQDPWRGSAGYYGHEAYPAPGTGGYPAYPHPPMTAPRDAGSNDDDNDGIANRDDRCPDTPADNPASSLGCAVGEAFVVQGVTFDASGKLSGESMVRLDALADILNASEGDQIEVSGHTDATDDPRRDEMVSAYRAITVMKYLADRGVIVDDMIARAYGGTKPVASNETEEGRNENRRIEIVRIR